MKTRVDAATEKFLSGYNCAQSVLWAFAKDLRLDPDTALKIATGFGAGMGRRQDTCGAVSGAVMALGLVFGRGEGQERTATEETYARTQEFMRRFEAKHVTCNCRQLLRGCNLMTEEGRKAFMEDGLHDSICKACVQNAVSILEDMLKDDGGTGVEERMKRLWSGTDQLRLTLLRAELDAKGIRFVVKNESLSIATGYLPAMEICPEVWIVDAERFEEARAIADYLAKQQDGVAPSEDVPPL